VNEQATAGYDDKIRNSLKSLWEGNDHRRILELLAENPYVLSRSDLAFFRAICCEQLHDYRGAALFFADALKWGANDPDMLGHSVAAAIMMTYERRLAEAELYLNHLLELVPHALTFAAASILRLYQAKAARNDDQRRSLMREQLRLCESAGAAFSDLPETQSQSPSSRAWMVLCLECASFAALGLGDRQKALGFSDRALVLAPSKSGPYTSRGTISYPSRQAVEDFLSAERLGEKSYISCYYLAHDALTRNEFRDAEQWCGKALRRSPGIKIKAQLYEWLAICRAEAHSDPNEIRTLFHLAKDLDPKNPRIEQNYSLFESSLSISQPNQERPGWEEIVPQPPDPLQEQDDLVSAYALPDSKIAFEMHSKFVGRVTRQAA
jgi:tetratricopeptide (TPR) repeat protein